MPPRGPRAERDHPRRQAGRAVLVRDRRAGPRRGPGTKMGHAGTLDPFATGLLLLLSGRSTRLAGSFVGLDKRYLTDVDLTARTSTGDPEGDVVERRSAPAPDELERAARGPPRRDRAADPGRVRGQDRRRARLQAAPPRRRGRDAAAALAGRRARRHRVYRRHRHASTSASARVRTSGRSPRRSAAIAWPAPVEVGPFSVEEADEEQIIPAEQALARLP